MTETWSVLDDERMVSGAAAAALVSAHVDEGQLTTYFVSDLGRLLVVVSNGTRSMLVHEG